MGYTGGYTVTENGSAYDRGVAAGGIAARIAEHEVHLSAIGVTLESVAAEIREMRLEIQRQGDRAEADRAVVLATARALKDAEDSRRNTSEQRWSPLPRLGVVFVILGAVSAIAFAIWSATRP